MSSDELVELRGRFISRAIFIESRMNTVLADFFVRSQWSDRIFRGAVLQSLTWAAKVEAISSIVREVEHWATALEEAGASRSSAGFEQATYSSLKSRLDEFGQIRNVMAHREFFRQTAGPPMFTVDGEAVELVQTKRRPKLANLDFVEPLDLDRAEAVMMKSDEIVRMLDALRTNALLVDRLVASSKN